MTRSLSRIAPVLIAALSLADRPVAAEGFRLDLEAGAAWQLRNDFAVPGSGGTRLSIDEADRGPFLAARATLWADVGERSSLRLVAAPFRAEARLTPETSVEFDGATFAAGEPLEATWVFDSWRLSYVWRFRSSGPVSFRAGLTAKIRDARIELAQGGFSRAKTNTGFVPLLYGGVRWQMTPRLALDLEADGAAASQGRAVDVAARLEAKVSPGVDLFLGARTLEGGVDGDEVYSFAWIAYGVGGVSLGF
ncbi:MAG: porin family protein [Thermoanaerobaculia bacterium]